MNQRLASQLFFVLGAVYFYAFEAQAQGTFPVFPNIIDHSVASGSVLLGASGNRLVYFDEVNNKYKLWFSDGTPEGTRQVSPANQTEIQVFYHDSSAWYFTEKRGSTYHISVLANDMDTLVSLYNSGIRYQDIQYWNGKFFWIQNSASSGYSRLQLYNPADSSLVSLLILEYLDLRALGKSDSLIYFIASTDTGKMLGSSGGTVNTTKYITSLYPAGNNFDQQSRFFSNGDKVYFFYHPEPDPFVLWTTDGTAEGTVQLGEYQDPDFGWPSDPAIFLEDKLFFILREPGAPSGTTFELHVSDGTPTGTITLDNDPDAYTDPTHLTLLNDKIFYIDNNEYSDLNLTDGTLQGTKLVLNGAGHQTGGIGLISSLGKFENSLMVGAYSSAKGSELYRSNGTANGTTLLSDVIRGSASSYPRNFTEVEGRMFFTASYASEERLWIYDPDFIPTCDSIKIDTAIVQAVTDSTLGSISITMAGGQQPYVYSLNNGANTYNSTFSNLVAGVYNVDVTDNLGCSLETSITISTSTSIIEPDLVKSVSILPNPSVSGQDITVKLNLATDMTQKALSLSVYSLDGTLYYHDNIRNTSSVIDHKMDAKDWPKGQYVVCIFAGNLIIASEVLIML